MNKIKQLQVIFACACISIGLCSSSEKCSADLVIAPGNLIVNTLGASSLRPLTNATTQLGLSVNYISGVTEYSSYVAQNPLDFYDSSGGSGWIANVLSQNGNIDFDFGQEYDFKGFLLWNLRTPFAVQDLRLFSASDSSFSDATLLGSYSVAPGPNIVSPVQEFGFATTSTQFLRVRIDSANTIPGFAEIAFRASAVPEPSSLVAICSLAPILLLRRARRLSRSQPIC